MGLRILSLVDKKFYDYNIDRTFFHTLSAIERHVKVDEILHTGRGWGNYNISLSVEENIQRLYKAVRRPDLVLVFLKDFEYKGLNSLRTPKCIRNNEMYNEWLESALIRNNIGLAICHHENDMRNYLSKSHMKGIEFRHIPHCVNTSVFKHYNVDKEYDILLAGVIIREVYPFRHRLRRIVNNNLSKKYRCKVLEHPGYRPAGKLDTSKYRVLEEFSKEISKAKITLTCSSRYKYALTKYMEIPLSNSLIAADIPDEKKSFFREYVLELNAHDSDEIIINKLSYYLLNDSKRQNLVDKGAEIIRKKRNLTVYADSFVNIVKSFLKTKN